MKKNHWTLTVVAGAIGAASLTAAPAHAHISTKGALQSRGGDQKQSPCDGAKGDGMVYTFAPGATITLAVNEDVPHPSYFRIAFDNDGEDFVEPASIDPIDKTRACPYNADDQCGKSDYCTTAGAAKGAVVLWDNLDPHLQTAAKGGSWNIKLPDVECANCTLQVLQVMEDVVHGAYCPQGSCAASGASLEDIYHRCIDIKLVKGATNGPGASTAPAMNMGMECPAAGAGTAGSGGAAAAGAGGSAPAAGSGGTATAGSAGAATGAAGASAAAGAAAGSAGSTSTAGTPSAGAPATSIAGKPAVGAAGSGAVTSTAGTGTIMSPATGAGALATDAPTPAPASDSGCSVVAAPRSGVPSGLFTGTTLIALALYSARRRAKSRAGKRERAR
ncbi:MAG TPA: SCE4755 family polysaccharide monooxygenase-like protein [Polyangiales bacterium]|nr:SCE4755 family polysaccharide monooxygenase-like protein [Polyangiales bacterium]